MARWSGASAIRPVADGGNEGPPHSQGGGPHLFLTYGREHEVRIGGHLTGYFNVLASNMRYYTAEVPEERAVLAKLVSEATPDGVPHHQHPTTGFVNSLSVGVSLFCEDGDWSSWSVRINPRRVATSCPG